MKKTWKSSALCIGTAMLGAVALSGTNAMAGDVTVPVTVEILSTLKESSPQPLSFGTIDLNPAGDILTLNASALKTDAMEKGTLTAASGSVVGSATATAAAAGYILLESATALKFTMTFPRTLVLTGGAGPVPTLSDFETNSKSTATAITTTGGTDYFIPIGAVITFPALVEDATYTGDLIVTIAYE